MGRRRRRCRLLHRLHLLHLGQLMGCQHLELLRCAVVRPCGSRLVAPVVDGGRGGAVEEARALHGDGGGGGEGLRAHAAAAVVHQPLAVPLQGYLRVEGAGEACATSWMGASPLRLGE